MSGTPSAAFASTQNPAGARAIAMYAMTNVYAMHATAVHEMSRTPRLP
jgi:hypothetical protein